MTTYRIPDENLLKLTDAVAKVAKAARKLGLAEPTLTLVGEPEFENYKDADGYPLVRKWQSVEVVGVAPVIAGWTFAGVVQFVADDAGNVASLLRSVPGETIPVAYRNLSESFCDHCLTIRKRKDTYLVHDDGGVWKMVGSSCLKDFTGHDDPQALAALAEMLAGLGEFAGECEDPDAFGGGGGARLVSTRVWLIDCARSIRENGWTSRGKAKIEGGSSTYDRVDFNLFVALPHQHRDGTAEDVTLAETALAWVRDVLGAPGAELDDYQYSLLVSCRPDYVERRLLGIQASLIPAYERAEAQRIERTLAAAESNWQGVVGAKLVNIPVTILSRGTCEGFRGGVTHIIKMRDAAGNRYVWFATSLPEHVRKWTDAELDDWMNDKLAVGTPGAYRNTEIWNPAAGDAATVSGTVKAHNEFRGVRETVLTRCKVTWEA